MHKDVTGGGIDDPNKCKCKCKCKCCKLTNSNRDDKK